MENRFGDYLGLGISQYGCYATIIGQDIDPPYYAALSGEKQMTDSVSFWTSQSGHVTEVPAERIILFDELMIIAKHFCKTGKLEENFRWIEV